MDLSGKTYVVTGGTGFLGAAIVNRLLRGNADVHVAWWLEEELARVDFADRVTFHQANLAEESDVEALFGSIDGLYGSIHTAGGFAMAPIAEVTLEDFNAMMMLNAGTAFLCCREAINAMRRAGGGGRIVNVAARPALEPVGGMIAYTTSKAAVASMSQCLAKEVLEEGILLNAIAPSLIDTPPNRAAMPDADHASWPTPEEIAATCVALAAPSNTLVSGSITPVYGRV